MLFISCLFSVKIPERVINIWLCGFLENNTFTFRHPAFVTLFLLQTDPAPTREGTRDVALTGTSWLTPVHVALVGFFHCGSIFHVEWLSRCFSTSKNSARVVLCERENSV